MHTYMHADLFMARDSYVHIHDGMHLCMWYVVFCMDLKRVIMHRYAAALRTPSHEWPATKL
jgi:hypothetical protein